MNKQIIIIGAGIAGLSAAKYLQKSGIDVIVLEAQDRIGGRIHTDRSLGFPIEQGAAWIHKNKGNPISTLAQMSSLKTIVDDVSKTTIIDRNGQAYTPEVILKAEKKYKKFVDNNEGKKKDNFASFFYKKHPELLHDPLWTFMLSAYLEFDTGSDIYTLSARDFYDDEEYKGDDLIVTNGLDQLLLPLAQDINIQLGTKVESIDYRTDVIHIQTNKENYFTDAVICTVPLGVLQAQTIAFTPPLPAKHQLAIDSLHSGLGNKFTLVWDTPFWDVNQQYIGYTGTEKGAFNYFFNMQNFLQQPALMTFAFGDFSLQTEHMSDEEIIQQIIANLQQIYPVDIPHPLHFLRTNWLTNPHTLGTYSFVPQGVSSKQYKSFETPLDHKIYFAGEHTSRDYRGTIHGAFLSGKREAQKVLYQLNSSHS